MRALERGVLHSAQGGITGLRGSSLRFSPILTTKPGVPRQGGTAQPND